MWARTNCIDFKALVVALHWINTGCIMRAIAYVRLVVLEFVRLRYVVG